MWSWILSTSEVRSLITKWKGLNQVILNTLSSFVLCNSAKSEWHVPGCLGSGIWEPKFHVQYFNLHTSFLSPVLIKYIYTFCVFKCILTVSPSLAIKKVSQGRTFHFLLLFLFNLLFQFLQDLFRRCGGQKLHHFFTRFTTLDQKEKLVSGQHTKLSNAISDSRLQLLRMRHRVLVGLSQVG